MARKDRLAFAEQVDAAIDDGWYTRLTGAMTPPAKNPGGRPSLPREERRVNLTVSVHPRLLAELDRHIPAHLSRSALVSIVLAEWLEKQ